MLATALDTANRRFLNNNKSPSRKAGELVTRGSHFYLAIYWGGAKALSEQSKDKELQAKFTPVEQQLTDNENKIVEELNAVQGKVVNIGGYYRPNRKLAAKVIALVKALMRLLKIFKHIF